MLLRALVIFGTLVALVAGCGSGPPLSQSLHVSYHSTVVGYLKNHPADVPRGWKRGVLVAYNVTTHAWTGSVVTADGKLASLRGSSYLVNDVTTRDDIMWTGDPVKRENLRILTRGVVTQ